MNIFSTPDWESTPIGDERAKELVRNKVNKKVYKKLKSTIKNINSWKEKPNEKQEACIQNVKTKKGSSLKTFVKDTHRLTTKNELKISKKNVNAKLVVEKVITKETKFKKLYHEYDSKNGRISNEVTQKVNKKKMARLKKRNKQIEDSFIGNSGSNTVKTRKLKNKYTNIVPGENQIVSKEHMKNVENRNVLSSKRLQNKKNKLINILSATPIISERKQKAMTLRERMMEKLKSSRFRYINEQIYNSEGKEAQKYFETDPNAFHAYHEGYRQQVAKWPLNPLDIIIRSIKKMPSVYIIADFGCGEAKLVKSVPHKVYSFDFIATNEYVTACDMSHVPLENESVDVVVFCLSLMGTNIREYLYEANRILKKGGKLKIAEIESRFDTVDVFIEGVRKYGFTNTWKDFTHNLFYFLDFEKISKCKSLNKLPTIGLLPCLYKKR